MTTEAIIAKSHLPNFMLRTILIIEGASVMFIELAVAKILAPYYGSTLTTWSSALGVTMSTLAIGYYLGGVMSSKSRNLNSLLLSTLFVAGICTLLTPYLGKVFMFRFSALPLELNILFLSAILLAPSLICFGAVPPIIIEIISKSESDAGTITGQSFSISTLGGIVSTLIIGFVVIPNYGITIPLIITSCVIVLFPIWYELIKNKKWIFLIYFPLLFAVINKSNYKLPPNSHIEIKEHSEGLLGQLMVADYPYKNREGNLKYNRMLMINRMPESTVDPYTYEVVFGEYTHIIMKAVDPVPNGSNVLLLGLGAGNLVKQFEQREFNLDACELDERIANVAFKMFGLEKNFDLYIDDARHYINTCSKQYDLIVLDLFKGENPPAYLLSKESFERLHELLAPNGMIVINFNGFITGDIGASSRSVIKTILRTDFNLRLFTSKEQENFRNMIMVLSNKNLDYSPYQNGKVYASLNSGQYISDIRDYEIPISSIDTLNAFILTDDSPLLDILNQDAAMSWRSLYNEYYTNSFTKAGIPMFK